jgi:hypothetical protein
LPFNREGIRSLVVPDDETYLPVSFHYARYLVVAEIVVVYIFSDMDGVQPAEGIL